MRCVPVCGPWREWPGSPVHRRANPRRVRELLEEVTHERLSEHVRFVTLDVGMEDDEGDVVIPRVLFYVK